MVCEPDLITTMEAIPWLPIIMPIWLWLCQYCEHPLCEHSMLVVQYRIIETCHLRRYLGITRHNWVSWVKTSSPSPERDAHAKNLTCRLSKHGESRQTDLTAKIHTWGGLGMPQYVPAHFLLKRHLTLTLQECQKAPTSIASQSKSSAVSQFLNFWNRTIIKGDMSKELKQCHFNRKRSIQLTKCIGIKINLTYLKQSVSFRLPKKELPNVKQIIPLPINCSNVRITGNCT